MNLKRTLTATAITAIALTTAACQPPPAVRNLAPTEDSPGWDCLHQGNHICGPITARFNDADDTVTFSSDANGVIVTTSGYVQYPNGTVCRTDSDALHNICANPYEGGKVID